LVKGANGTGLPGVGIGKWVRSGFLGERGKKAAFVRLAGLGSFGEDARWRVLNGLEVEWVRSAWTRSNPKNDRKNAGGPTEAVGTGPAIIAGTPRATGNSAGKDRRRYG
jgi:hypothetical protein